MASITRDTARRLLMAKQRLAPPRARDVAEAAQACAGLLAVAPTMYLSLLARVETLSIPAVEDAVFEERKLGRIPAMRAAVYAFPREMLPVAFQATRASVQRVVKKVLIAQNIDEAQIATLRQRMTDAIPANTTFTIQTLMAAIGGTEEQLVPIIAALAGEGILVRARTKGGWRSNLHEYARFQDWFPGMDLGSLRPEQARVRLAVAYLRAFGPASSRDYAWWAGIPQEEADKAFAALSERIEPCAVDGSSAAGLVIIKEDAATEPPSGHAALLPAQDPFLLGYYDRSRYAEPATAPYIWDKAGNATSVIVIDGDIVGVWDFEPSRRSLSIRYSPFKAFEEKRIEPAVDRLMDFLELKEVRMERVALPEPFAQRAPGSFEHPLKQAPKAA
ncbi:MAG: winged helix DNA-binding domain-containing protein [Thermoplasmatota archaeon]